jgi:hypothetical protein
MHQQQYDKAHHLRWVEKLNIFIAKGVQHIQVQAGTVYQLNAIFYFPYYPCPA